jgi:hypothetical protein
MSLHDDLSTLLGFKYSPMKSVSSQMQQCTRTDPVFQKRSATQGVLESASGSAAKRPKVSEDIRRQRYLKEDYVSCLLLSTKLDAYDGPNGRPYCHSRCNFGCREH